VALKRYVNLRNIFRINILAKKCGKECLFCSLSKLGGLPTNAVMMILPFIIGLIVGYLAHKFLKIAIIAAIIIVVVAYFGFFGLSFWIAYPKAKTTIWTN